VPRGRPGRLIGTLDQFPDKVGAITMFFFQRIFFTELVPNHVALYHNF
jgi:hypothetical protein